MSHGFANGLNVHIQTPLPLYVGGTNSNLTAANGAVLYSGSTSFALSAATSTALQPLLSGSSTTPTWATAKFSSTYSTNNILYSNGSNNVVGLATANGGALVTSNSGVPSILAGSGTSLTPLAATASGTPAWTSATYPTTTTSQQLLYSSANNVVSEITTGNYGLLVTDSGGVPSWNLSGTTTGNYMAQLGSAVPTQNIMQNPILLQWTNTFQTVSGTTYWVYIGYVSVSTVVTFIEFYVTSGGTGIQTAEVAIFSTPAAPNRAAQTLTKLTATGSLNALTGTGVLRNSSTLNYTISAGTHVWAAIRTVMGSTQPTFIGVAGDYNDGMIFTKTGVGALTSATTVSSPTIPTAGINAAQVPNLRICTL